MLKTCAFLLHRNMYASNYKEGFEDTNGVIRIRQSKRNRQHNGKKGQATIYKTYT